MAAARMLLDKRVSMISSCFFSSFSKGIVLEVILSISRRNALYVRVKLELRALECSANPRILIITVLMTVG